MIGIIGAGNMGKAIAVRLKDLLIISDTDPKKLRAIKNRSAETTDCNVELVKRSDTVILAVKPQSIKEVLLEIKPYIKNKLVISIAAGVTTNAIERILGKARVIRVMPNMPSMVGKGISAVSRGRFSKSRDINVARKIFSKVGEVVVVKEDKLDAVTALSGSGPAYYFLFTDLLEKAGVSIGLNKDLAKKLALATFFGSAEVAKASKLSMEEFVQKVASKGGTTEAALKIFKKKALERTIKEALISAFNRSKALSKLY